MSEKTRPGIFDLFTQTFSIFWKHADKISILFLLYLASSLWNHNIKIIYAHSNLAFAIISVAIFFTVSLLSSIATLNVIDQDSNLSKSLKDGVKIVIPTLLTLLLIIAIFLLFLSETALIAYLLHSLNFTKNTILIFFLLNLAFSVIVLGLGSIFILPIIAIERKYYLKALARSLQYITGNIFGIFVKYFITLLLISLPFILIGAGLGSISDTKHAKDNISAIFVAIPSILAIITVYLLYKSYRFDLPEDFSMRHKKKILSTLALTPVITGIITAVILLAIG